MLARRQRMTRFRCGHCGSRLVMLNRHLSKMVACHACGRATHPAGKAIVRPGAIAKTPAAATPAARACANCGTAIGKLQIPRDWRGQAVCHPCHGKLTTEHAPPAPQRQLRVNGRVVSAAAGPGAPAGPRLVAPAGAQLELSAGPLVPVLLFGATGAAFFVAVSFMSYIGGFVSALALVAVAAMGLRWVRLGTMSVRARLDQIESLRLRHGNFRVAAMLGAWLWAQPARRKPWAGLLVLFWAAVYAPYCLSGMLLPVPRTQVVPARAA
jgi:hypothetical protein